MPRYLWFAGPEGCLVVEATHPNLDRITATMRLAGEFEADDHAAAHAELGRRMVELLATMEANRNDKGVHRDV